MTTAAIYARISDDREGRGLGVARQEKDCRALCQRRRWKVHRVYVDNDLSAYSGRKRPSYNELLDDLKAGGVDAVVCWHPDRLHRSPRELEDFIDLIEATGATVASVTAGDYDLATPTGRMVARMLGAAARGESEHKAERIRSKHLELAQAGKPSGGWTRPFGYEKDFVTVRPEEAALIRDAAARVLAGESLVAIASEWNARGITTTRGNRWRNIVLRRVLMSHRIAGQRSHAGVATAAAVWPAIIDIDTSRRLRLLLSDPTRRSSGSNVRSHLLSGLLLCGRCGARLVPHPRRGGPACYSCKRDPMANGCGRLRILAEPLEQLVVARFFEALDEAAVSRRIAGRGGAEEDSTRALAFEEAQLEQLAIDYYDRHEITREQFFAASRNVKRNVETLKRKVVHEMKRDAAVELVERAGGLRARWETGGMTLAQKRAALTSLLESVTVSPAGRVKNRFDAERVPDEAMRWRV